MQDVFSRIGLAFSHIAANSTLVGAPKEEVVRLADELQAFEAGINSLINEAVLSATETLSGQVASLEARLNALATSQTEIQNGLDGLASTMEAVVDADSTTAPAAGLDSVSGTAGTDSLPPVSGTDTIDGGAGNDTILAGSGNDAITGDQSGTGAVVDEQPAPAGEPVVDPAADASLTPADDPASQEVPAEA